MYRPQFAQRNILTHSEVFIRDIPPEVQRADLIRSLAKVLHAPPFRDGNALPVNFDVHLLPDRDKKNDHRGLGTLTLPTAHWVALFLDIFQDDEDRPTLDCDQKTPEGWSYMTFECGQHQVRRDVLDFVRSMPYRDPTETAEHEERVKQLQVEVDVRALQFGKLCREGGFSAEWTAAHWPQGPFAPGATLQFLEETREILLSLGSIEVEYHEDVEFAHEMRYLIRIHRSSIERIAFEGSRTGGHGVLLFLTRPPAFELQDEDWEFDDDGEYQGGRPITRHTRLQFLPGGGHDSLVPYISSALRLQLPTFEDFDQFVHMATIVHLPGIDSINDPPFPVALKASRFHPASMTQISTWINKFSWPIAFQLQALLTNLVLDPLELVDLSGSIVTIQSKWGGEKTSEVLRLFKDRMQALNEEEGHKSLEDVLREAMETMSELYMEVRREYRQPGTFDCYHVNVMPTRLELHGPYPDQSNRVIRQFPGNQHCFLRVCFVDEDGLDFRWGKDVDGDEFIRQRVGGLLAQPGSLDIAGRKFSFLSYSSSGLRDHAVWFVTPFRDDAGNLVDADSIRNSLGDFTHLEYFPARMGARMAQAFTATEPSITLDVDEDIPVFADIERNGSCFTDGVGDISKQMATIICRSLEQKPGRKRFYVKPSAFQFRLGGYKGVLAVNPELDGVDMRMRKSMLKFESSAREIEVAQAFYKTKPFYLNRYIIMILETLGVPHKAFIDLQDRAVAEIRHAGHSLEACAKFMDAYGCGNEFNISSIFLHLKALGVGLKTEATAEYKLDDPFLRRAIQFASTHSLRIMKHKARIPVKGSYTLVGVADVAGWLRPNQVFVCIKERRSRLRYIKGRVLITRSPQVHPGDVQYVEAIGDPPPDSPFAQERFPNCVVFSTQGERSVPSMLAGGDLDGDEYNVILDESLYPPRTHPPAQYPPAIVKRLDHPCDVQDLANWVVDYINSDILGLVSQQFLLLADQSDQMAEDPNCVKLAELASKAVDFAKSGTPVRRSEMPGMRYHRNVKPDWAAGELGGVRQSQVVYESRRAIGVLFRRIDLSNLERAAAIQANRQQAKNDFQAPHMPAPDLPNNQGNAFSRHGSEFWIHPISKAMRTPLDRYINTGDSIPADIMVEIGAIYEVYAAHLRSICSTCSLTSKLLTEEEVFVGVITAKTSQPRKRSSMQAQMRTQTEQILRVVRHRLAGRPDRVNGEEEQIQIVPVELRLLRGWAAWQLSLLNANRFGAKSFGMLALFSLFEALKEAEGEAAEEEEEGDAEED